MSNTPIPAERIPQILNATQGPGYQAPCDSNELVALMKSGNIEVLDRVTRCFGDRLMSAARRYCSSEEDAADAVQEAALAAWKYGDGYRGEGRIDRWLVRLVASACHRLRRGMKNDPKLHVRDLELIAGDASPADLASRAELAEALGGVLMELPLRDRVIVLLADGQGWTGPEIADALDMTPGSVRTRLSRAHSKLRGRLDEVGVLPPG